MNEVNNSIIFCSIQSVISSLSQSATITLASLIEQIRYSQETSPTVLIVSLSYVYFYNVLPQNSKLSFVTQVDVLRIGPLTLVSLPIREPAFHLSFIVWYKVFVVYLNAIGPTEMLV